MAEVEPVTIEEAQNALALRNERAKEYIAQGYSLDESVAAATISMLVLAYRAAVEQTGAIMADDVEKFLEGQ